MLKFREHDYLWSVKIMPLEPQKDSALIQILQMPLYYWLADLFPLEPNLSQEATSPIRQVKTDYLQSWKLGEEVGEQQFHNKNQEDKGLLPVQQRKCDVNNTEQQIEISEKVWENAFINTRRG